MSTQPSAAREKPIGRIALGSDRAAKIMSVRAAIARVAELDPAWRIAKVIPRPVKTDAPVAKKRAKAPIAEKRAKENQ